MAVSHVKNPLSVIAIFASLAELGGTVVLPTLAGEVQLTYVWFLMLFPTFLVGLFFITLWFAHTKLYAPSDFSDEKNWVTAAGDAIRRKYREEVIDAAAQGPGTPQPESVGTPPVGEPENTVDSTPPVISDDATEAPPTPSAAPSPQSAVTLREAPNSAAPAVYLAAEELAFLKVTEEFGPFRRHVSPADRPRLIFDGAQYGKGKTTLLEVKYTRRMPQPMSFYRRSVDHVANYFYSLSSIEQRKFSLILAVVTDRPVAPRYQETMQQQLLEAYSFSITLRFYVMDDLQQGMFG
ncbi:MULTISPECIES: hypothetical protein [unclassified Rhizobium]|uniref:hypothetical protein n=1 Tax=unclassified Rhizobium TaxID=2613769 RepID=UPI00177C2535|nr:MULTISPECIES: hypothetical protein [unclassified Rhizobium]MBD8687050.1 hypothetical protein [Rhizobium sp. CFBP 13644]MBD8691147.1 hypothetical protein [Rhizobium sp. CFBP 13717]